MSEAQFDRYREYIRDHWEIYPGSFKGSLIVGNRYLNLESEIYARFGTGLKGYSKCRYPTMVLAEDIIRESDHLQFEKECYEVAGTGYYLRPTSEAIIYPHIAQYIRRYSLPIRVYQIGQVYRKETNQTRPLLRAREISFFESHSFHRELSEAEDEVRGLIDICQRILGDLKLPYRISLRTPEETFPGARYTYGFDIPLSPGETYQVCSTHQYGDNFSSVFGINIDRAPVYQTTMGLSERLLGVILYYVANLGYSIPDGYDRTYTILLYGSIPVEYTDSIIAIMDSIRWVRMMESDNRGNIGMRRDRILRSSRIVIEIGVREFSEDSVTIRWDSSEMRMVRIDSLVNYIYEIGNERTSRFDPTIYLDWIPQSYLCDNCISGVNILGIDISDNRGLCLCGGSGRLYNLGSKL